MTVTRPIAGIVQVHIPGGMGMGEGIHRHPEVEVAAIIRRRWAITRRATGGLGIMAAVGLGRIPLRRRAREDDRAMIRDKEGKSGEQSSFVLIDRLRHFVTLLEM